MKSRTSQQLFAYWNDVRKGRFAPHRFEIEPSRISPVLSETFILERLDPESYRFRLAGTRICEEFGAEFRGTNFLDGWTASDRISLARHLQAITQQGGVGLLEFELRADDLKIKTFECLLLPLVHTRDSVDRLLGALSRIGDPRPASDERLALRRLTSSETIWPDGRPHAALPRTQLQVPFLPHVRNARIVRSERRQFRVYEGGLGKPGGGNG